MAVVITCEACRNHLFNWWISRVHFQVTESRSRLAGGGSRSYPIPLARQEKPVNAYAHYEHPPTCGGERINPDDARPDVQRAFKKHLRTRRWQEGLCDSTEICKHKVGGLPVYRCAKCDDPIL
jgi:hypothetical protein